MLLVLCTVMSPSNGAAMLMGMKQLMGALQRVNTPANHPPIPSLPPNESSVRRSINYTPHERTRLLDAVERHRFVLATPRNDRVTNRAKRHAWDLITNQFNSHDDVIERDADQLKT